VTHNPFITQGDVPDPQSALLDNRDFTEALAGFLLPDAPMVYPATGQFALEKWRSLWKGRTTLRLTIACASKADRDSLLEMRVDAGTLQTLESLSEYVARLSAEVGGRAAR
jgi:hypothetical protein